MNVKKVVIPTYLFNITEEERIGLSRDIKAVNDGEGGIDDYPLLKKFCEILEDIAHME